jgi:hypothetical protein
MLCSIGKRLNQAFAEATHLLVLSDREMKDPNISYRVRNEDWTIATIRVNEAREALQNHATECFSCSEDD